VDVLNHPWQIAEEGPRMRDKPTAWAAASGRVSRTSLTGAVAGAPERDERLRVIVMAPLERRRSQSRGAVPVV
jgi:hypothetical protein